jgi:two-component system LytT family response regulator
MNTARAMIPPKAIRAIIVDDESLLRKLLRERLERHPEIVIVGEAHDVQSAVELVAATRPDIIFLDVQMPPDNGFDLLPRLEHIDPLPAVVFVTAFDHHALRAFEVNALDYLTKPVHPDRLAQTVARLHRAFSQPHADVVASLAQASSLAPETPLEPADLVRLQDGSYLRFVEAGRIAAAQSQGDYTIIHAAGGKPVMIKSTLSHWEVRLPAGLFCRISRSLLVNSTQIQQVSRLDRENTQVFFNDIAEPLTLSRLEFSRLRRLVVEAPQAGGHRVGKFQPPAQFVDYFAQFVENKLPAAPSA